MGFLLLESKRDELLFPYITYLHENGIDVSLGEFKSAILKKLANEGGIRNLSLRSNYYLAGAARYYFNGDLTLNKPVSLLSKEYWENNGMTQDNWNEEACSRLNTIIYLLRNSYIDSIGINFEQPEDFGKLSFKQLLKKYGKKIDKTLGGKNNSEHELNTDEHVGNNYTFEIMYSQADCQKYERPTAPGSWCITYGLNHYNGYVRSLNIHYVIFRQDGWENIQRPKDPLSEPGFTREKPHDAYGNSLIAVLQSNTSPEPVYITSRWNHGYGVSCAADHAYTKEEFQQITGVTDEDLKRIYDIWKKTKSLKHGNGPSKQQVLEIGRAFKYAQMRINSGENPETVFDSHELIVSGKNGKLMKSTAIVYLDVPGYGKNGALFDNGKVVFETLSFTSYSPISPNIILFKIGRYHSFYNTNRHKITSIDGTTKFKYIIGNYDLNRLNSYKYIMVKQSTHDIALIDTQTFEPLKLPNGQCWFNDLVCASFSMDYYQVNTDCTGIGARPDDSVIQIIYDASSNENYLFNINIKKFIQAPKPEPGYAAKYFPRYNDDELLPKLYRYAYLTNGYFAIGFRPPSRCNQTPGPPYIIFDSNGNKLVVDGCSEFRYFQMVYGRFIALTTYDESKKTIYDLEKHKSLTILGKPIEFESTTNPLRNWDNEKYLGILVVDAQSYSAYYRKYFIYDVEAENFRYHSETDGTSINDYKFGGIIGVDGGPGVMRDGIKIPIEDVSKLEPNTDNKITTNDIEAMVNESIKKLLKKFMI